MLFGPSTQSMYYLPFPLYSFIVFSSHTPLPGIQGHVFEILAKRIKERLALVREHEAEYEEKYGMDYETFHRRMALDEDYYNQTNHFNPLWEQDALEWEYWHEEVRDWTSKLEAISSDS